MDESRDLVPVAPLLVTIVAVVGITSAVWSHYWSRQQAEYQQRLSDQTEQYQADRNAREALLNQHEQQRLAQARKADDLKKQLDNTRSRLAAVEAENWPARYQTLKQRHNELSDQLAELQQRHSMTHRSIAAEQQALQARHDDLEAAYILLELEHDALRETHAQDQQSAAQARSRQHVALSEARAEKDDLLALQASLERDLISRELSQSGLRSRVLDAQREQQRLRAALADSEEHLQQLLAREQQLTADLQAARQAATTTPPLESRTTEPQPRAVAATTDASGDSGFRLARLQSLKAAVADASSRDRRLIILTVLPSIPGGVRGPELADLIAGMETPDIIELIESGRSHIRRPLDNMSYRRIMQQLADESSRRQVTALLQ